MSGMEATRWLARSDVLPLSAVWHCSHGWQESRMGLNGPGHHLSSLETSHRHTNIQRMSLSGPNYMHKCCSSLSRINFEHWPSLNVSCCLWKQRAKKPSAFLFVFILLRVQWNVNERLQKETELRKSLVGSHPWEKKTQESDDHWSVKKYTSWINVTNLSIKNETRKRNDQGKDARH